MYLTSILNQYIHRGVSTAIDMQVFSFLLKSVSNYILASVTLKKQDIFRNVAYIGSTFAVLQPLLNVEKPKE